MKFEKFTIKKMEPMKDPPLAWMPTEVLFKAEFCGSDTLNFIYIRTTDPESLQNHANIRSVMDKKYSRFEEEHLPEGKIVENSYVVLKDEHFFHRAKVIRKDEELGLFFCVKIDEGTCSVVGCRQIFRISEDLMKIPRCTIRCKLQGMDFFDDLPHLELGYKLIKMREIMIRPLYSVQVLGAVDDIPYVNLSRYGMGLVNEIQKFVPILCEPQVPKPEIPFEGEVLNANSKACIWIRHFGDDGIATKIVEILKRYKIRRDAIRQDRAQAKQAMNDYELSTGNIVSNEGEITTSMPSSASCSSESGADPDHFLLSEELWKEKYLEFPTGIFVAEYVGDLYRVKVVKYLQKNKIEVEFIDFGNRQVTSPKRLIPVQKIDQNLAFIPPQCLKTRLHGFYRMNMFYFWKFLPTSPSLSIVIKDQRGDEERGIEIDILGKHKPELEDSKISVSEAWRTSSPDKLALCSIQPLEKSTGVTQAQNKGQTMKRCPSTVTGRKQRGAFYKMEGVAVDQRLRRLLLSYPGRSNN